MLLSVLALSLCALATGNTESPQPCRIQSVGNQPPLVAPQGYRVRSGGCPGNDIWSLYRDRTTLANCARLCSSSSRCQAFMFYNNHRCYPKTKTCGTTTKTNPLNVFYDKLKSAKSRPKQFRINSGGNQLRCVAPQGYNVRSGGCPGNDIWSLYRDRTTLADCARLCSSSSRCQAFMFYNNHRCYPKTKTCGTTTKTNPLNVFYDKVVSSYTMRPGDCSGNDIWYLYKDRTTLADCARRCNSSSRCQAFMFFNNHRCYPKSKTCGTTTTTNPLNVFYDKVPSGYAMRPANCSENDIWELHQGNLTRQQCAQNCDLSSTCTEFMHYDNRKCYTKTKGCVNNNLNIFYDKIPVGYAMRPGDCSGNDMWSIHGFVSLAECAKRCNDNPTCVSFMFFDGRECYPKTKTCKTTDTANPKNFFYDKILLI